MAPSVGDPSLNVGDLSTVLQPPNGRNAIVRIRTCEDFALLTPYFSLNAKIRRARGVAR